MNLLKKTEIGLWGLGHYLGRMSGRNIGLGEPRSQGKNHKKKRC